MADDTFAMGGGSVIITSAGVYKSESNLPSVMKAGTLRSKSNKWSPYFFVLRGDIAELQYFKNPQSDPANPHEAVKGTFKLGGVSAIKPTQDKKYPFCFEIEIGKKKHLFAVDMPDERESWMHHLRKFCVIGGKS